jgi:WD40 repeat protein
MKQLSLTFILVITALSTMAQSCPGIYDQALLLFKKGEYDLALKKLEAYKLCAPEKLSRADSLIVKIYQTVNSQRIEAENQTNIANQRAKVIENQKDSIERENFANKAATQALQVNELDPTAAVQYVYAGLCFSPNNPSLTEIKRKIFSNEIIRKNLDGASKSNTTVISSINGRLLYSGDAEGNIKLWDPAGKVLLSSLKVFNERISAVTTIGERDLLVSGNDSKDFRHSIAALKLVEIGSGKIISVAPVMPAMINYMSATGDMNTVILGDEKGEISRFSLASLSVTPLKKDSSKIVGIQCWQKAKRTFYATALGIYELESGKTIYKSKPNIFITYFGFCQSTGIMYIGTGEDLVLFDYLSNNEHLLYPIHRQMITSCHCADSTGAFLTTSLDGNAVLWTADGNVDKILKGNRPEIYDGFLPPDGGYAITVGRRELNAGKSADTNTAKYWYLKGFFDRIVPNAHFTGATAVVNTGKTDFFITSGVTGSIKVWDNELNLIDSRQVAAAGISKLLWDSQKNLLAFGTFSGETGTISISNSGKAGDPSSIKTHIASAVTALAVHDQKIYSAGKDGMVFIQSYQNDRIDSIYFDAAITAIDCSQGNHRLLIASGNDVILFDSPLKKRVFKHKQRINALAWLSPGHFVTLSGQMLRIWAANNTKLPIVEVNNNIRNEMTSLYIDHENKVIYTGTWSGYVICWDYSGKQLYEFDQLASLGDTNIVNGIAASNDGAKIITADYNGNIAAFYSPFAFLQKELKINMDCAKFLKMVK